MMTRHRAIWMVMALVACCLQVRGADKYTDENRPYEFGFNIEGEQHRHEKKDENGLIMGEFGFITADGVYHVTVYATDENGNFKILSMKNIRVKPYPSTSDRASNSRAIDFPPSKSAQPVAQSPVPSTPLAAGLSTLPKPSPVRSCSGCSIPTTTTQAPKQLKDLAVISSDDQTFPPYTNQPANSRGRQLVPEQNQAAAPLQPSAVYVPPKYDQNGQFDGQVGQQPEQFGQQPGAFGQQTDQFGQQPEQIGPQPGQFEQHPNQFGQQPSQFGQEPGQFGQQPSQFGQQPGQFGQQPSQFSQQPGQFGQQPEQIGQQPSQFGQQPQTSDQLLNNPQVGGQQFNSLQESSKDPQDISINSRGQDQPGGQFGQPAAKPQLISAQMRVVDGNTDIHQRGPGEQEGLPNGLNKNDMLQLLYTFNYTVGFHGHHEEGYTNGVKKGYYYVTGRDGVRTRIDYVADGEGFHPKISSEVLDLLSEDVPKPDTERDEKYGLKGYEFKWIYYPLSSR